MEKHRNFVESLSETGVLEKNMTEILLELPLTFIDTKKYFYL